MMQGKTFYMVLLVAVAAGAAVSGCTGATPGYCEATTDCDPGNYCNLDRNACEPLQDIGVAELGADGPAIDAPQGQEGGADLPLIDAPQIDGPVSDTLPPDLVKPDTGLPPTCSDDVKNQSFEVCDGKDLNGNTCKTEGYDGGTIVCASDCKSLITTGCYKCGDKKKNGAEKCDDKDFGGATCKSLGKDGGTLTCSSDCKTILTTGCYWCGDGKKNGTEECEGSIFGTATCATKGFECGNLSCTSLCKIVTTGCEKGWAVSVPGTIADMATDSSGNTYVTGTFSGSVKFGTTTLSGSNLFIAKLSPSGTWIWAKAPGGSVSEVNAIAVDSAGHVYVAGELMSGSISFGMHTVAYQGDCGNEVWVAKLSSTGAYAWAKAIGGASSKCEYVRGLGATSSGLLVLGHFSGTAKFGTITKTATSTSSEVFVAKMNTASGDFSWVTQVASTVSSQSADLAVDSAGNGYISGWYTDSIYFTASISLYTPCCPDKPFMAKITSGGVFVWAKPYGSISSSQMAVDGSGNSYLASELTCLKLNSNGGVVWTKNFGTEMGAVNSVAIGSSGVPVVTGSFSGSSTIGSSSLTSKGGSDVVVARLNSSTGYYVKAVGAGGTGSDVGSFNAMRGTLTPYVAGTMKAPATFGSVTLTMGTQFIWNPMCAFK